MDKLIYILWDSRGQDRKQRQQVLLKEVAPKLLQAGASKLTMYIVDQDSDFKSAAPFHPGERMCADVSLWLDSLEQRASCEEIIKEVILMCNRWQSACLPATPHRQRHSYYFSISDAARFLQEFIRTVEGGEL